CRSGSSGETPAHPSSATKSVAKSSSTSGRRIGPGCHRLDRRGQERGGGTRWRPSQAPVRCDTTRLGPLRLPCQRTGSPCGASLPRPLRLRRHDPRLHVMEEPLRVEDLTGCLITLLCGDRQILAVVLDHAGSINRQGDGTLSSSDNVLYIGVL